MLSATVSGPMRFAGMIEGQARIINRDISNLIDRIFTFPFLVHHQH
jgi:hypothetical protein